MFQFASLVLKFVAASILVGAALSAFDVTAAEILQRIGLTPERLAEIVTKGIEWAVPNLMLGSIIIIPFWCLAYMLRPPRG